MKLDEAEPVNAIETIPERDPLLENPLEEANLPEIEYVPEPEKASASISSEIDALVEEPLMFAEAPPEVPEVFEPVPSVELPQIAESGPNSESALLCEAEVIEIEPFEFEAGPEQLGSVPEPAEVQQIILEAAPSETQQAAPEAVYSAPELPQDLPEPEIAAASQFAGIEPLEVEATPEQVEAVPAEVQQIILEAAPSETQQAAVEAVYSVPELPLALPEPEITAIAQSAEVQPQEVATANEPAEVPQIIPEAAPGACRAGGTELIHPEPEMHVAETSSPELSLGGDEAERVSQAVDRVFNRFKRLLVAAIVRELARPD